MNINQDILKKLQSVENDILYEFADFCEKYNLKYYLIGGTLLGTVRYNGFVPWDNDIDVAMPRDDYERLKELWNTEGTNGLFLQSSQSDPLYSRGILKLRRNGTEIIEKTCSHVKMNTGIYIDIFPIDYLESYNYFKINTKAFLIKSFLNMRGIKCGYDNGRHSFVKKILKYSMCFIKKEWLDKLIEKLCVAENKNIHNYAILYLHNYSWKKQIHKAEVFGEGIKKTFEGEKYTVPSDWDSFLSKVFGLDYLKEPEKDKRKSPHNYIKITIDDFEYLL